MPTGLRHIQEGQLDERVFSQVCNTWEVAGALTIEYCYDLSAPSVSATVKLRGVTLGVCSLDTHSQQCTVGGSVDGFKAEVTVHVDFDQKKIVLTVELCVPLIGCKSYSTTLNLGMDQQNITLVAIQQTLGNAVSNQKAAGELLVNPAAFFRRTGLDLSQGRDDEFNLYFRTIDPDLENQLSTVQSGQKTDLRPQALGCWACKTGVWTIAAAIVAFGAAEIAVITPEAEVVLLLARFAGLEAKAVAGFISGLGAVIQQGVNAVANAICRWLHAC